MAVCIHKGVSNKFFPLLHYLCYLIYSIQIPILSNFDYK